MKEIAEYLNKQNIVEKFAVYANKNGLRRRNLMINKSHKLLERFINSRIIYNILNEQEWIDYLNHDDPTILKALDVFKNNEAFPKKPENKSGSKKQTAMVSPSYDYHSTHVRGTVMANV